ncbi:unnamed protein product [Ectocarpus sp. 6 AP-2014]
MPAPFRTSPARARVANGRKTDVEIVCLDLLAFAVYVLVNAPILPLPPHYCPLQYSAALSKNKATKHAAWGCCTTTVSQPDNSAIVQGSMIRPITGPQMKRAIDTLDTCLYLNTPKYATHTCDRWRSLRCGHSTNGVFAAILITSTKRLPA